MIKTVNRSKVDRMKLSSCRKNLLLVQDAPTDYRGLVVIKPWGYEYLVFENNNVAIWILSLKKGRSTSMHCHPKKKTSLTVLSGQAVTSFLDQYFELEALDALRIDAGVFHSTQATSEGVLIMETETPPNKLDLVRLKDEYGREGKGYEGNNQMSNETSEYEYLNFYEALVETNKFIHKNIRDRHLRIQKFDRLKDLYDYLKQCKKATACFLNTVIARDRSVIFAAGDIISKSEFGALDTENLKVNSFFHALIIH